MKYIPYTFPVTILEFMNNYMNEQMNKLAPGEQIILDQPTITDYYNSIPEKYVDLYEDVYHNAILRTYQLMTNEGFISPLHHGTGFNEKYQSNGFDPRDAKYGKYDFVIFGFQYIHDTFEDAVRPVILNHKSKEKQEKIGTGFVINANRNFDDNFYFITARHCLPIGSRVYVPAFLPKNKPCIPKSIWVPANDDIDVAIIKFDMKISIPGREQNFWLSSPEILDQIMTMGYPPIQGFMDAVQVSEVANISGFLKSTLGRITGEGKHYWGGKEDHFLISARVKGGNSGGPVINKEGEVVGMIIELPQEGENIDLLGYGLAINANIIDLMIKAIENKESRIEIKTLEFQKYDNGFELVK